MPFTLVPHSRALIESIIDPLYYHDNTMNTERAVEIYSHLLNDHHWDIRQTQVIG